jgi:hypothetical protein
MGIVDSSRNASVKGSISFSRMIVTQLRLARQGLQQPREQMLSISRDFSSVFSISLS